MIALGKGGYASGAVALGYDQDNNLTSVQNPFGESTGYAWDLANRLNTITLANGSVVSIRYDDADRLVHKGDNGTTGLGFSYYLDANGNRLTITENDGSAVNNTYDVKNRLTLETRTGTSPYSNGYSYDLNDNLISARGNSYSVDIMGRITNAGFVYDNNGRLTTRPGTDGTTYLSYDYAGRCVSMTLGSGLTISYALDGDGRMIREKRAGKNVYYLLDGKNVLKEWGTQVVTVTNTGGTPAGVVALRPRDLVRPATATAGGVVVSISQEIIDYTHGLGLLSQRTTLSRFYRFDGIGSLRNLEDSSRNIVASSVFDAYGLQQNSVTLASAYGFIGEEGVRGEKGQAPGTLVPQNMRARMYDPLTGRFTSRDPIWDKNLYGYANGNPWSFTDAEGMQAGLGDDVTASQLLEMRDSGLDPASTDWMTEAIKKKYRALNHQLHLGSAWYRPEILRARGDISATMQHFARVKYIERHPYQPTLGERFHASVEVLKGEGRAAVNFFNPKVIVGSILNTNEFFKSRGGLNAQSWSEFAVDVWRSADFTNQADYGKIGESVGTDILLSAPLLGKVPNLTPFQIGSARVPGGILFTAAGPKGSAWLRVPIPAAPIPILVGRTMLGPQITVHPFTAPRPPLYHLSGDPAFIASLEQMKSDIRGGAATAGRSPIELLRPNIWGQQWATERTLEQALKAPRIVGGSSGLPKLAEMPRIWREVMLHLKSHDWKAIKVTVITPRDYKASYELMWEETLDFHHASLLSVDFWKRGYGQWVRQRGVPWTLTTRRIVVAGVLVYIVHGVGHAIVVLRDK